jgi:predicted lactoylglutathione lyase
VIPARVTLVTLGVADVPSATAFYERLGWVPSPASVPGEVTFIPMTNGVVVGLWSYASLAGDAHLDPADPTAFRGVALAVNVGSDAEVDRILAEAQDAGATLLKPGTRADWGGYSGYFADPDGNAWEVAYNPGWPIRPDGSVDLGA